MIPGNDDALRAIRLFASKIADSVVEGSQAATDKQMADVASGIQYSQAAEAAAASPEEGESFPVPPPETSDFEEVSMEEVLGKGGRRAAAENTRRVENSAFSYRAVSCQLNLVVAGAQTNRFEPDGFS